MIEIDHICLGARNFWESTHRLTQETGLGNAEGGWFPEYRLANRIVPTGGDTYIEVEGVIDAHAVEAGYPVATFFHEATREGDCFIGWCARVDSRAELDAIARRLGSDIFEGAMRMRADGSMGHSARTPDTSRAWKAGLPNFFYIEDRSEHAGRLQPEYGTTTARGIAWMELGGSAEEMSDYLGVDATSLGLRFNGGKPGLHAMGIRTDNGEAVIRRPVMPGTTGKL